MWNTFLSWKECELETKHWEPVLEMDRCLPLPIMTLHVPVYGVELVRFSTFWVRWWLAPESRYQVSSARLLEEANITGIEFWLPAFEEGVPLFRELW
jgi:hypothetical protein